MPCPDELEVEGPLDEVGLEAVDEGSWTSDEESAHSFVGGPLGGAPPAVEMDPFGEDSTEDLIPGAFVYADPIEDFDPELEPEYLIWWGHPTAGSLYFVLFSNISNSSELKTIVFSYR